MHVSVVNNELIERNDSDKMTKTTVHPVGVQTYANIVQKTSRNLIHPNVTADKNSSFFLINPK